MKKVIVISLGGSLIVPDEIDVSFLKDFKKVILKNKLPEVEYQESILDIISDWLGF